MVQWNLNFTISKISAILILGLCSGYAYYAKDVSALTLGVTVCAGLLGFRQAMTTIKEVKVNNTEK